MSPPRSTILTACVGPVVSLTVLLSVFLLLRGHNAPGGGFVGGLVAGGALVLRHLESGAVGVRRALPFPAPVLLGTGLSLALATGIAGFLGGAFLDHGRWDVDAGPLGEVHLTTTLLFDVGVYLVVLGVLLTVLTTVGAEAPAAVDGDATSADGRAGP